jgi:hypothetical protein
MYAQVSWSSLRKIFYACLISLACYIHSLFYLIRCIRRRSISEDIKYNLIKQYPGRKVNLYPGIVLIYTKKLGLQCCRQFWADRNADPVGRAGQYKRSCG